MISIFPGVFFLSLTKPMRKTWKISFLFALLVASICSVATISPSTQPAPADNRYYEMRVYYAAPGKLEDLNARFRNHTTKIFEKHGMTNIGYWVPLENPENKLIYVLAYKDKEAREKAWKDFMADPDWQKAQKASEVNGKLVDKVDAYFMKATDYSPAIKSSKAKNQRTFELRTYNASTGKLNDLHARFRNHTMKLFTKYGMKHVGYWEVIPKDSSEPNTLIYILAHDSKEAGEKSFKSFREDPKWVEAKKASEVNGSLTEKVESVYMKPTDYSQIK
jgi:phosphopantetheine adenylyltransferase